MTRTPTLCQPENFVRMPKSRRAAPPLRREVENMLRDVAFVLAQTARVRDAILEERGPKMPAHA